LPATSIGKDDAEVARLVEADPKEGQALANDILVRVVEAHVASERECVLAEAKRDVAS
jgi:hypothetical protein